MDQIGKLIEKLKEIDWLEDTLVVITSDHGMSQRPIGLDIIASRRKEGHGDIVDNVVNLSSGGTGGFYLKDTSSSMVEKQQFPSGR